MWSPGSRGIPGQHTRFTVDSVQIQIYLCVFMCIFQQPRIISNHRSPFGVDHAFSGQSTPSTQCLPEELALCNTKYLHYFIFFISMLFLVFVAKILWAHKDWQRQGLPRFYRHTSINWKMFLLFLYDLNFVAIVVKNKTKTIMLYKVDLWIRLLVCLFSLTHYMWMIQ